MEILGINAALQNSDPIKYPASLIEEAKKLLAEFEVASRGSSLKEAQNAEMINSLGNKLLRPKKITHIAAVGVVGSFARHQIHEIQSYRRRV